MSTDPSLALITGHINPSSLAPLFPGRTTEVAAGFADHAADVTASRPARRGPPQAPQSFPHPGVRSSRYPAGPP